MSDPTFTPPVDPSKTSKAHIIDRKLIGTFGDGYVQRVPDGLKISQRIWDLVWNNVGNTFAETIAEFFETVGESVSFYWTDLRGDTKKYVASNFNWTYDDYNSNTITVTLTEDLNGY